jgi:CheY-like chemotaxis protein
MTASNRPLVFVIDDDDDTRACVCSVLEEEGYAVASAKNGREALEMLRKSEPPTLVLLDLMMPVMSGWDVLEAFRHEPKLGALPVVVFTAAGDSGAADHALAKPILRKPIDLDLLLAMVKKICDASWPLDEPPSDLMPPRVG